jgi:hypothetical protein
MYVLGIRLRFWHVKTFLQGPFYYILIKQRTRDLHIDVKNRLPASAFPNRLAHLPNGIASSFAAAC